MIIIGIDENGYGPILGPLIVTATAFKVQRKEDLWHILNISKNPDDYPEKLVVTDSKKLFFRNSLRRCQMGETAVLAFFYLLFRTLPENPDKFLSKVLLNFSSKAFSSMNRATTREFVVASFMRLCFESENTHRPCWENVSLLLWLKGENEIREKAGELRKRLGRKKIKFLGLKSICVCPFQFNRLTYDKSKSYLNYLQFEKLISYFLRKKEREFHIFADRIGGQRGYMSLLKSGLLKNWNCRILEESREVSSYELNLKEKIAVISFLQNGEEKKFPVALSSLFGKYIREIFMKRINKFFQNYNPELKPVSGYRDPLTKNFIEKTKSLRKRLKINEECFLRNL